MSHMSSYTRGAARSGHGNSQQEVLREPTQAEYIALTMAEEHRRRVKSRTPVSLGGPVWSRPQ